MTKPIQRRAVLAGAAALAVVAFDPLKRSWITEAHAHGGGHGHGHGHGHGGDCCGEISIPGLDGELTVDPDAITEAADDFGHIVSRAPIAVLRPGSDDDIRKMVKYANDCGLKVAMRGQGHSTLGQAQVEGGVVIDSRTLNTIHEIECDRAVVDAGVTWNQLVAATVAEGLTPPVLTDYLDLSVGGTLSVGGIGGATNLNGVQIDNVIELEVVTGEGKLVKCSKKKKRKLFEAVLGGLGQYGIITRATVKLVPAPESARIYRLVYSDIEQYVADQTFLAEEERFDYLEGQAAPNGAGGFQYTIEAAAWFSGSDTPDDGALLAGLSFDSSTVEDQGYEQWLRRLEPTIAFLKLIGVWGFPHPWIDLFVPASEAANVASIALSTVAPDSQDPILFYPFLRSNLTRPLFMVPDEPVIFLFDILRTAPPIPGVPEALVDLNRSIYDAAAAVGSKKYPISSIPFDPADWEDHYGEKWEDVLDLKAEYDPNSVLTPGQGIFP
ncbi:MAG: FAD-binding protein [Myxococcales bacterium]|nr:FAD-binding protein [Myxococcales bacterium]